MVDNIEKTAAGSVGVALDRRKIDEKLAAFKEQKQNVTPGELVCHAVCRSLYADLAGPLGATDGIDVALAISIGDNEPLYPVIRNAQALSLADLATQIKDLSLSYFRGELTDDACAGGSFTYVDLSSLHAVFQVPPLLSGQAATVGLCDVLPGTDLQQLMCTFDSGRMDCGAVARALHAAREIVEG